MVNSQHQIKFKHDNPLKKHSSIQKYTVIQLFSKQKFINLAFHLTFWHCQKPDHRCLAPRNNSKLIYNNFINLWRFSLFLMNIQIQGTPCYNFLWPFGFLQRRTLAAPSNGLVVSKIITSLNLPSINNWFFNICS